MHKVSQRFADWLIRFRWPLLAAAVIAAAVALPAALNVEFDRRIENMFAADDPLLPPYRRLKETFGGNEIVMAVYNDRALLEADGQGIQRLATISKKMQSIPGVKDVLSLDRPIGKMIVAEHNLALRMQELFAGYTHSSDGNTVAVVCMLTPEDETKTPRRETIEQIRQTIRDLPDGLAPGMIAGEPVMVVDGFRYVEEDGWRLGVWTTILLALVIVACFRSLRWVLIPIAVVQFTLLLTRATLVWSGLRLSMVSTMLTAIVTVVGIAAIVHVIVRFRSVREAGLAPRQALTDAIGLMAAPIFWACMTNAVGFLSLTWAKVGPVSDFGVMMAIGSLLVLVGAALVVPGLAIWGRIDTDPRRAWGEHLLDKQLQRLTNWVHHRPRTIAVVALVASALTAGGLGQVEVETDFTRNFRQGSPVVRSYQFVETNLGGAGVLDIILPGPEQLDWPYLKLVQRLEARLRDEVRVEDEQGKLQPGLTKVLSLSDAIIAGSPINLDNVPGFLSRVTVRKGIQKMRSAIPAFVDALYSPDPGQTGRHAFRIMLRARERQPAESKRQLIAQVRRIVDSELAENSDWKGLLAELNPDSASVQQHRSDVTGFFVLLTNLIESMIRDQWVTFGIATAGIGLMMLIAFRSPRLALVALIPNVLSVLMVLGVMGWIGMKINMGAAMIAAVSMGLSIDSEIHYITSFRRARNRGLSVEEALDEVQQSVGRAVVFSTLALIVGFSVLATSEFVPTIYFGVLVSFSMLAGLAGNLIVLPLLLKLTSPRREKQTITAEEHTEKH